MCDGTEIDEILTLRTMTLTEDEKRAARGTDHRAAAIIERADTMPGDILERLHGAVRYLRKSTNDHQGEREEKPWWNPEMDTSVAPATDSVRINGVAVPKAATSGYGRGRGGRTHRIFFSIKGSRWWKPYSPTSMIKIISR